MHVMMQRLFFMAIVCLFKCLLFEHLPLILRMYVKLIFTHVVTFSHSPTIAQKLVVTSSRTALLVAMMYHNLTTELSRAVLDQRVAVEG